MQESTKTELKARAATLIAEHVGHIETAHSLYNREASARFDSNPEGLKRDDFMTECSSIWDQAALQAGARPQQQSDQASARR